MPEHVHLLMSEPERRTLAVALQMLKQIVSRKLSVRKASHPFWQARYYDFNVWSERKYVEKLRYIHRNPVVRGLVSRPEDWRWSSYRHYLTGEDDVVRDRVALDGEEAEASDDQMNYPSLRKKRERLGHPAGARLRHRQFAEWQTAVECKSGK